MIIGVPVKVAIGTSSVMVALSALMGFAGHSWAGDFTARFAFPVCAACIAGGYLGSHTSIGISAKTLGYISGALIVGAGIVMTLMSIGIV